LLKSLQAKSYAFIFVAMSKRIIWIVSVFMGMAMAALLMVQAYWIKNAILVKEKQFDQLITRAMIDITHEIERIEVTRISSQLLNPLSADSSYYVSPALGENLADSIFNEENNSDEVTGKADKNNYADLQAKRRSEARQYLNNRRLFVDRIIAPMFSNSPRIEDRISASELEDVIHKVLNDTEIDLPFEYAVLRMNNDTAYHSGNYNPYAEAEYYSIQLFPNDIYVNSNYLKLYFPEKESFLYRSLSYLAVSSLLLTLAILLSFTLTVFIMFRQKRLSEIRSDFISNMTHELKTPISTISLASQMLGDKSIPAELKNTAQISKIISEECRRLGNQVEKVLQTSVFDKGKLKLRLGEVNMHEIITGVVDNFSIQVKSRNGKISTNLQADNFVLQADQVHITNVMSNLLDNAIKYSTFDPEIKVETANKMEFLMISVSDNGIGINRTDQKRIFEKFYRVPTGNVHTVKGFGLGLSYVKMTVEAHHGYVEVESELHKGSTFKFFLPMKDTLDHAKD
jgi:two-component system phosphate regulon sensor histidine kinase PhoR